MTTLTSSFSSLSLSPVNYSANLVTSPPSSIRKNCVEEYNRNGHNNIQENLVVGGSDDGMKKEECRDLFCTENTMLQHVSDPKTKELKLEDEIRSLRVDMEGIRRNIRDLSYFSTYGNPTLRKTAAATDNYDRNVYLSISLEEKFRHARRFSVSSAANAVSALGRRIDGALREIRKEVKSHAAHVTSSSNSQRRFVSFYRSLLDGLTHRVVQVEAVEENMAVMLRRLEEWYAKEVLSVMKQRRWADAREHSKEPRICDKASTVKTDLSEVNDHGPWGSSLIACAVGRSIGRIQPLIYVGLAEAKETAVSAARSYAAKASEKGIASAIPTLKKDICNKMETDIKQRLDRERTCLMESMQQGEQEIAERLRELVTKSSEEVKTDVRKEISSDISLASSELQNLHGTLECLEGKYKSENLSFSHKVDQLEEIIMEANHKLEEIRKDNTETRSELQHQVGLLQTQFNMKWSEIEESQTMFENSFTRLEEGMHDMRQDMAKIFKQLNEQRNELRIEIATSIQTLTDDICSLKEIVSNAKILSEKCLTRDEFLRDWDPRQTSMAEKTSSIAVMKDGNDIRGSAENGSKVMASLSGEKMDQVITQKLLQQEKVPFEQKVEGDVLAHFLPAGNIHLSLSSPITVTSRCNTASCSIAQVLHCSDDDSKNSDDDSDEFDIDFLLNDAIDNPMDRWRSIGVKDVCSDISQNE
uniref:Uncharacterized protein n=1 Tax=Corethron hystrix TaxID=216773 RepID=A0A7S1C1R7_9STRA|mmetsp:Transcript_8988/g.19886  ORF Transcript_8988/g.19886 Transcript_8988/m.19886 type:complete len:701 (+) Transcript_8988:310-2412(+)